MWPSHQSESAWLYVGPAVLWNNMTSALRGKREGREGREEKGGESMEERRWRREGTREGRREDGGERGGERMEEGERVEGRKGREGQVEGIERKCEEGLKRESVWGRERKTNVCDFMCHIWRLLCRYNIV